jgi:methionyl-tRNA synthetase
MAELQKFPQLISASLDRYRFREAGQEIMNLARLGNKFLAESEPWKVIKQDEQKVKTIMYVALQIAAGLAILSEPFLPFTAASLRQILNFNTAGNWGDVQSKKELLAAGHHIGEPQLLFRKIEDKEIQDQLDKLAATKVNNESENKTLMPQKETISYEEFAKMDMRVGTILEAEKMAKTKKLMVLKVDTGLDTRTIVSGIAESFSPEEIIGKKVTVLVNLAPRPLRGVDSEGMILMTENKEGKLVFLNPDEDEITNGEIIS